jgi:uncharacterized protein
MRTTRFLWLSVVSTALLGAGTAVAGQAEIFGAAGGPMSIRMTSLKEMRFKQTVHQQEDFSCGSAAVATLLTYHYEHPISEREVLDAMYAKGDQAKIRREGFSLLDMKNFLESRGFKADGFQVPLDMLAQKETPAIALIRENGYNHFVVVKGIRGKDVLLGDPALGTRVISREIFEAQWLNKIVFVIHNRPDLAQFNAKNDWAIRPGAPASDAVSRDSLANITVLRMGPNDF